MMSKENFPGNNTGYSDWLFITSFLLRNDFYMSNTFKEIQEHCQIKEMALSPRRDVRMDKLNIGQRARF